MATKKNDFKALESKLKKKLDSLNTDFDETKEILNTINNYLMHDKEEVEKMKKLAVKYETINSDIIKINVGGTYFSTLKATLEKKIKKNKDEYYEPHLLQSIVSGMVKIIYDETKAIFLDRNPKYFGYILDYLRNADSSNPFSIPSLSFEGKKEFLDEAVYYNLHGLVDSLVGTTLLDSVIIKEKDEKDLFLLCNFIDGLKKCKLLYRASRDGFRAANFHAKCDGVPNTLTIIKTTQGYVFGGYTTISWDQSGAYKNDSNAFIFSFTNNTNKPVKMLYKNDSKSTFCNGAYGPTFGGGADFHIADNCNSNSSSCSDLGRSYTLDGYTYGSTEAQSFLAGANNFTVSEIEVFQRLGEYHSI